jgi:RNA polymerase sigma-70 factor (ECF subfamily)
MGKWMNPDLAQSLEPLHQDACGWARYCCDGSLADPGDVLQTAYLKVIQGKARPSGTGSLKTWWFGVIRLTTKEEQRRRRFRESLAGKLLRLAAAGEGAHSAVSRIELDGSSRELKAALTQLPTRQSEVLHLVFYQDLSISEAAGIMGISLGSARTHYERGKARLRELLSHSPDR